MDSLVIRANGPLQGAIPVSGAKNAALPLMIASLLTDKTLTLENVPRLADVSVLQNLLSNHGVDYRVSGKREDGGAVSRAAGQVIEFKADKIVDCTAPYDLVRKMRAGFWVIGPLLARCGEALVSLPGGCAIGTRPVDFFIEGLTALGAQMEVTGGYVKAKAPKGKGLEGSYRFPKVSVGATHTLLMATCLGRGHTILENAALEPEVGDLIECLNAMGAKISGIHTSRLEIEGVSALNGARHRVLPDRIESGTFAACAAAAGGDVLLEGARADHLEEALAVLRRTGTQVETAKEGIRISRQDELAAIDFATAPYPGFPTDLQAQFMALATCAKGTSEIRETIFENRFMHVQELNRLGADISVSGQTARVSGVPNLSGAPVMATDLRASVSLVIAGLVARGETRINRLYHLDRGFERLEEKLRAVGADIERIAAD